MMAAIEDMARHKSASTWSDMAERVHDGVVQLRVVQQSYLWSFPYRKPMLETIYGSGWIIDNKEFGVPTGNDILIVTNAHVAKEAFSIVGLIPALGLEPVPMIVLGVCVERDIALLKIADPEAFLALYKIKTGNDEVFKNRLGDSDKLRKGSEVLAVGFPLGMHGVKTTKGIVSGYEPMQKDLYLSITAPINPGNSGGPLYNSHAMVVGINSAKLMQVSRVAFAIPSQQLAMVLDALYTNREFMVPELGFKWSPSSPDLNEYMTGLKQAEGGIFIRDVAPGGLFSQAGVVRSDILLAVDDLKIDNDGELFLPEVEQKVNIHGLLTRKLIGADLKLHVYRGAPSVNGTNSTGTLRKLSVKYDQTPIPLIREYLETTVDVPRCERVAGLVFMQLTMNTIDTFMDENPEELVEYMDSARRADSPQIIITNVVPNSLAGSTKTVKAGRLVQEINGRRITDLSSLCSALSPASGSKFWTMRTGTSLTVLNMTAVRESMEAEKHAESACAALIRDMSRTVPAAPADATADLAELELGLELG